MLNSYYKIHMKYYDFVYEMFFKQWRWSIALNKRYYRQKHENFINTNIIIGHKT